MKMAITGGGNRHFVLESQFNVHMPIIAIALLFGSAILHTSWNLLLKQAGEKYVATWWAVLLGSAIFLPVLPFTGLPVREVWPLLLASVLVEAGYYTVLSSAYQDADFSLVYPLSRGAAPVLIAIWSVAFLEERFTTGGTLGLGIIILGLLIVGGSNLFQRNKEKPHVRGIALALILAVLISIYTTVDGAAVKRTPALPYAVLVFFLAPALTAPVMFQRYGWQALKFELVGHRFRIIGIGLLTVSSYLLALAAYAIAPVSYSGAVREVSVVLGALTGWLFLRERLGKWRLAGALVIFCGILVIAKFG
ncbi:MAG TPA: EamA family transporter [Anaerolineales bacterium]|jgi:drug/metabolite transporter (DMT)-like permease